MVLNKVVAGSVYRCFKERRVIKVYLVLVRFGGILEYRDFDLVRFSRFWGLGVL